jgi:PAS domain S-box-containing protein
MKDERTTKHQLIAETGELRRQVADMETAEARHRQREVALRESEMRFRTVADFTHDWEYWRGPEGSLIYISPSCERITGYRAQEFQDDPALMEAIVHPDDRPQIASHIHQESEDYGAHEIEFRILTRSGEQRWIGHVCQPVRDAAGAWQGRRASNRDITQRKQAEEALKQRHDQLETVSDQLAAQRNLLRTMIDNLPDSVYAKDAHSRFLLANATVARMMGAATPDDLLGKTDFDFYPQELASEFRADEEVVVRTGQPAANIEEPVLDPQGNTHWLLTTKVPLRDGQGNVIGLVGIGRDISERKQAEETLRASEAKYRELVENANSIILRLDTEGNVTFFNEFAQRFFGYTEKEILGKGVVGTIIPATDSSGQDLTGITEDIIRSSDRLVVNENENVRRDGERVWVAWTNKTVLDDEGRISEILCIGTDITERKQAEEALADANVQLEEAIERANEMTIVAEAANRAKSEFLANMSHEIRTPMNGIIGMTELALGTELTPAQREYLEAVSSSAEALLGLLNDILDFSKIEAGQLDVEEMPFDLRSTIEQVADATAHRATEKGLELMFHLHPDVPEDLVGDPQRLRQVLVNLIGNAIKFTEQGEVVVEVKCATPPTQTSEVSKTSEVSQELVELLFSVSDTGIGIPPDKLGPIFDPFRQADGSTSRRFGGTGLGLAISRQLVALMGGHIWAESEVGKGSTFFFTVTARRPTAREEAAPRAAAGIEGRRVLVIDDNAINRRILSEMVNSFGCRSREAQDGGQGLHMLQEAVSAGKPFDLVLLDVQMPGMDGFQVLEHIRSTPQISQAVVIVLTSVDSLRSVDSRRDLGWAAYLTKPVKQSSLLDAMLEALGEAEGETEAATDLGLPTTRPLRILVVEDNQINRRLATMLLEREGHHVVTAETGQAALDALEKMAEEETEDDFDLIFMDVQMPEMDGLQATAAIRADERWKHLPIIAMTAHAMKGDRERFLEAGMDDYLGKPLRFQDMLAAIRRQTELTP